MKTKTIALTTSALVAVAALATTASAAGMYSGKVSLGLGYGWEKYDDGGESWDNNASFLSGAGSVNIPYDDTVNLQLDMFGDASMDTYGNGTNSFHGGFAAGAHINYRDEQGALGVFAAVGRANASTDWGTNFVAFAAGVEGQYFCNAWTLRGQAGYLDSEQDGWLIQDAGFINVGADYYASSKLKLSGSLGYVDGADSGTNNPDDVTQWNWNLGIEYMFGKSVPVSTYLEYAGKHSVEKESSDQTNDRDSVNVGVRFYFGGDGDLMKADRSGAGMKSPDLINMSKYYVD